jgi:hypothetical protein
MPASKIFLDILVYKAKFWVTPLKNSFFTTIAHARS